MPVQHAGLELEELTDIGEAVRPTYHHIANAMMKREDFTGFIGTTKGGRDNRKHRSRRRYARNGICPYRDETTSPRARRVFMSHKRDISAEPTAKPRRPFPNPCIVDTLIDEALN